MLQVTVQKLVNGQWVDVSVPVPAGTTLTPAQLEAIFGTDCTGPYRLHYTV